MGTYFARGRRAGSAVLAAGILALAACSSPSDKANKFYEKGLALMKQGDLVKARVELQNALQIRQDLTGAWYALAQIAEEQGDWPTLFALLGKVIDYDPKHFEAQIKLGRMLLAAGKLDKALVASDTTIGLAADNPEALALRAAVLYKLDDKAGALVQANAALAKSPNNVDALVVLATERLAAKDAEKAIEYLDRALKANEKNIALQLIKVQALQALAKADSAEQIFRKLIAFYPETRSLRHVLAQFYLSHGRADAAEAEYRAVATENPKDAAARLDVVRFVAAVKGQRAAMQELEAAIAQNPTNNEFKFALASMHQAENDNKSAGAVLRALIEKSGDSADSVRAKGSLAAVLLAEGNKQGAQALIGEVLTKDQRNEQGLLLKASLAIDDRQLDQAIADLRAILRDAPNSPRALLLLAKTHELAGSAELAQEQYLKAYQAGRPVPAFGMAYAEFLMQRGQVARAESVAEEIAQANPGHLASLRLLAQARINQGNWGGAQAVAEHIGKLENQKRTADQILGSLHAARKSYPESIEAFRRAYDADPTDVQPMAALVRSYVLAGKSGDAMNFLNSVVQASPGNTAAHMLRGQLHANSGATGPAAQAFQAAIGQQPKDAAGYINLANLHLRGGRAAEAEQAVDQGLAAIPGDFALRMTKAGIREAAGRIDDAISMYEQLLKERPNSDVLANNLASLLSDHRTDKASLNRAYDLAQRFRRSDVPQFRDTLGWASHRVGKYDEAVTAIEDAARQLTDLPVVRYHLGMSYLALNRKEAARKELEKALALGDGKNFAEAELARQALKGL